MDANSHCWLLQFLKQRKRPRPTTSNRTIVLTVITTRMRSCHKTQAMLDWTAGGAWLFPHLQTSTHPSSLPQLKQSQPPKLPVGRPPFPPTTWNRDLQTWTNSLGMDAGHAPPNCWLPKFGGLKSKATRPRRGRSRWSQCPISRSPTTS